MFIFPITHLNMKVIVILDVLSHENVAVVIGARDAKFLYHLCFLSLFLTLDFSENSSSENVCAIQHFQL